MASNYDIFKIIKSFRGKRVDICIDSKKKGIIAYALYVHSQV